MGDGCWEEDPQEFRNANGLGQLFTILGARFQFALEQEISDYTG